MTVTVGAPAPSRDLRELPVIVPVVATTRGVHLPKLPVQRALRDPQPAGQFTAIATVNSSYSVSLAP